MSDPDSGRARGWRIDKNLPIALIITIFIQTGCVVWWASALSLRVDNLETQAKSAASIPERIVRLEERILGVQQGIAELKVLVRAGPTMGPIPRPVQEP